MAKECEVLLHPADIVFDWCGSVVCRAVTLIIFFRIMNTIPNFFPLSSTEKDIINSFRELLVMQDQT